MVRTHPDPPFIGGVAQLGERLLCKQEVIGSIPIGSTNLATTATTSFCVRLARALLFKNPEVLFLTLSFQANDLFE